MRLGLPMGLNVLLTIRGRTSGQPRTAPVAIAEIDGRRFIIGAYGEVQWVRNLRVVGEADIAFKGRTENRNRLRSASVGPRLQVLDT